MDISICYTNNPLPNLGSTIQQTLDILNIVSLEAEGTSRLMTSYIRKYHYILLLRNDPDFSCRCLLNLRTFAEAFDLDMVGAAWMYSEYSDYSAWRAGRDEWDYCEGRDTSCLPPTTDSTTIPESTTDPQTATGVTKSYNIILVSLTLLSYIFVQNV